MLVVGLDEPGGATWAERRDRIYGLITGRKMWVEPKNVDKYEVSNRLKMIFTSNKSWVVPAGKFARRWLVVDADEKYAKNKAHFERLYESMEQDGYAELMWLLQNTKLPPRWHPR